MTRLFGEQLRQIRFFSQVTYAIVRSLFKNRIFLALHPNILVIT